MSLKPIQYLVLASILAIRVLIATPVSAQVSGATLSGTITDPQGANVVGAKVAVTDVGTAVVVDTETNSSGSYSVPNLNPAEYEVSVSSTGFSTTVTRVTLRVGEKQELNLKLALGSVQQEVHVTGVAPQVDLESSTLSGNIEGTEVRELPLNGRDWASLAQLEPGVAKVDTHPLGVQASRGLGIQMTITGQRPTQNVYRLDGAVVNDFTNSGPGSVLGQNLGVDAIQEFSVLTSNYSAEYGYTSGGVINAVTRSGTNSFHGTAFDFLRNGAFDAPNYFANHNHVTKDVLQQNQFGGSAGYKVLKDKLFLFGDYEGVRQNHGTPVSDFTISNNIRNGIVTDLSTNAVSTVTVDPYIAKYMALYPVSNGPALNPNVAQYNFESLQRTKENFVTFRGDYKIGAKDSFFGTYVRDDSFFLVPTVFNTANSRSDAYRSAIILEETHVFSGSWVNTFRVALDRSVGLTGHFDDPSQAINPAAADKTLAMLPSDGRYFAPTVSLGGTGLTGGAGNPAGLHSATQQDIWLQLFQLYDDAFFTHGNHSIKFGFSFMPAENNVRVINGRNGTGTFTSALKTTQAVADCPKPGSGSTLDASCGTFVDFLTNQPRSAIPPQNVDAAIKHYIRDKIFGGYIQDDWRFRTGLTLNLGLRYEVMTNPIEKNGNVEYLSTLKSVSTSLRNSFFTRNPTLKNFEPRVGFAWDPFHDGKSSVRAGFGIFDSLPIPSEYQLYAATVAPFLGAVPTIGPPVTPSPAAGIFPGGIPGLALTATPQQSTWGYLDNNIRRNYIMQWNFSIERQLTPSLTLTVGYAGSHGVHSPFEDDSANTVLPVNVGNPIPGVGYYWPGTYTLATPVCAFGQVAPAGGCVGAGVNALYNPNVGMVRSVMWESSSIYHGLQVRVDKQLSHGFQVRGSFTWSKSIDDSSGSGAGDTFLNSYSTPPWYDLRLDRGPSDFNIPHVLVISGLYDAPTPHFGGGFGEHVLGGWQLGGILTLKDGTPMTPVIGLEEPDLLGEEISTVNPPQLLGGSGCNTLVNPGNVNDYIKGQCLGLVPQTAANTPYCDTVRATANGTPGTCPNIRGDLGKNLIIGPSIFNVDFSMVKNNYIRKISEAFNVQFRAEFFNVLNHSNIAPPGVSALTGGSLELFSNVGQLVPGFGRMTATSTPNRQIQFAIKMVW